MRKSAAFLALFLAFGLLPREGTAQVRKHNWEISPFFGPVLYGSELELKSDSSTGIRVAYNWTDWLGTEVAFDTVSSMVDAGGGTLIGGAFIPGSEFNTDITTYKADLILNGASSSRRWRGYGAFGLGKVDYDVQDALPPGNSLVNTKSTIFDVGAGVRWYASDLISVRGDLRIEYAIADSHTNLKPTVGISFHLGGNPPRDIDQDGVSDVHDTCADTPYGATVDLKGCPSDTDGDIALDGLDECPGTPEGWPVDDVGCPTDVDADGVPDGADQCADSPEGSVVDQSGCPIDSDGDGHWDGLDECEETPAGAVVDDTGCPIDSDGDGHWDGLDRCPDTPLRVVVDDTGCPVDSDDDGIFDGLDQCPGSAPGTNVDETGCPRIRPAVGEKLILEGVVFESGSAILTEESYPILEEVLLTMQYYGDWTFEVQGHTDSDGTVDANQALSDQRAAAVRAWFIEKGIDPARLTAQGFGESTPLTDNLTDIGKSRNRRVELLRTR